MPPSTKRRRLDEEEDGLSQAGPAQGSQHTSSHPGSPTFLVASIQDTISHVGNPYINLEDPWLGTGTHSSSAPFDGRVNHEPRASPPANVAVPAQRPRILAGPSTASPVDGGHAEEGASPLDRAIVDLEAPTTRTRAASLNRGGAQEHAANVQPAKLIEKAPIPEADRALLQELYVADPEVEMQLLEDRKDKIMSEAFSWILDRKEYQAFASWKAGQQCRMLWVRGPAGTGKTMLVMGIIKLLRGPDPPEPQRPAVAHFFCQGTYDLFSTKTSVLRSLLWQLLQEQPHLIHHLKAKFQCYAKPWFSANGGDEGKFVALSQVFQMILKDETLQPCYVVVDALDECNGSVELLTQITDFVTITDKVKWLVSSRPEVVYSTGEAHLSHFRVEIDSQVLKDPVRKYIQHKLSSLSSAYNADVLEEISMEINARAENTFLWVWFVFQELNAKHKSGRKRVPGKPLDIIREFPAGLAAAYRRIMDIIEEDDDNIYIDHCKHCLDAVNLAFRPMTTREMAAILFISNEEMEDVILSCGSFLSISQRKNTISFIHQSAKDYLDTARFGIADSSAWTHEDMIRQSIQAMITPRPGYKALHMNMYNLDHFGPVDQSELEMCTTQEPLLSLGPQQEYARLCDDSRIASVLGNDKTARLQHLQFRTEECGEVGSYLEWPHSQWLASRRFNSLDIWDLETGQITQSFQLDRLEALCTRHHFESGSVFYSNGQWFAAFWFLDIGLEVWNLETRECIAQYNDVEFFSATTLSSDGRRLAQYVRLNIVIWDSDMGTSPTEIVLDGRLTHVSLSPDNRWLACRLTRGEIQIWDVGALKLVQTLAERNWMHSLSFSADSKSLAVRFWDNTTSVWDIASGEQLQPPLRPSFPFKIRDTLKGMLPRKERRDRDSRSRSEPAHGLQSTTPRPGSPTRPMPQAQHASVKCCSPSDIAAPRAANDELSPNPPPRTALPDLIRETGATDLQSSPSPSAADSAHQPARLRDHLQTTTTASDSPGTSDSLWDRAYTRLDQALRDEYLKAVERVAEEEGARPKSGNNDMALQSVQSMAEAGIEYREEHRLKFTIAKKTILVGNMVSGLAKTISFAKPIIDEAVKASSAASIAWVGVSLVLPLITRPAEADAKSTENISQLSAMMGFYTSIEALYLDRDLDTTSTSTSAHKHLEDKVCELYKAILDYLCRSVLRFYAQSVKRVWDDILKSQDWDALYQKVTDAENSLQQMSATLAGLLEHQAQKVSLQIASDLLDNSRRRMRIAEQQLSAQQAMMATSKEQLQLAQSESVKAMSKDDRELHQELFESDPDDVMDYLEGRKDEILDEAFSWILATDQYSDFVSWRTAERCRMLWVRGPSGTGKTMLVMGVVKELRRHHPRVVQFFCQGANSSFNTRTAVLRSLIWQLLGQQGGLVVHLRHKFSRYNRPWFTPGSDDPVKYNALSLVLRNMLLDPSLQTCYVAVDALDECASSVQLLAQISEFVHLTDKVKWLISSRPEVVDEANDSMLSPFRVDIDSQVLTAPVQAYIAHKLSKLRSEREYSAETWQEMCTVIGERAQNTFLWVWLIFQELDPKHSSGRRKAVANPLDVIRGFPKGLADVYDRILATIDEDGDRAYATTCRHCIEAAALAFVPMTCREMAAVLCIADDVMGDVLLSCGSFLTVAQSDQKINLIHESARDYLASTRFGVAGSGAWTHADMARQTIRAMCTPRPGRDKALHRDMYNLQHFGPVTEPAVYIAQEPLASLRYSCQWWLRHCIRCDSGQITEQLVAFFENTFLFWVEAMCFLRDPACALILKSQARNWIGAPAEHVYAMLRLISQDSPLQGYLGAPLFLPQQGNKWSWQKPHIAPIPRTELPSLDYQFTVLDERVMERSVILRTWNGSTKWLAGSTSTQAIDVWDLETGEHVQRKLSASNEGMTFLTEGQQYACLTATSIDVGDLTASDGAFVLQAHSNLLTGAFAPGGKWFASNSDDCTVRVWDLGTRACVATLVYDHLIGEMALSIDGNVLAACSYSEREFDGSPEPASSVTVRDTSTCRITHAFRIQESIYSAALSPNNKWLACGLGNSTVQVWELDTLTPIFVSTACELAISSVSFSADGASLAINLGDYITLIRDIASGEQMRIPTCHALLQLPFTSFGTTKTIMEAYDMASHPFSYDVRPIQAATGEAPTEEWIHLHGKHFVKVPPYLRHIWFPPSGDQVVISTRYTTVVITCKCLSCREKFGS
ncbi:nacht and wd40 domain protein [Ophiostoma piceae UAMH 11346]|uniref:Nacht and wd40 domain protein n=1 Tax=Ophiostoma piceae (strain UAMH 11346) TaxID=1262450 RepID=S3CR51_OPHP1|nr:nacht and wd40 domain protein [Ophiostoma piceae UAMH 11346]